MKPVKFSGQAIALAAGALLSASASTSFAAEVPAELEAEFKAGMDALKDDRLKTAIEAFNSVLSAEPSLHRARLELALAYYRSLQFEEARRLAQEVLDDPTTPPEVRVTILAFLAQVDQDSKSDDNRHEIKPSISVGYLYDSNATVGPSSNLIETTIGDFTLISGLEQSDTAFVLGADVSHRYNTGKSFESGERIGRIGWLSQLSLYSREYQDISSSDQFILSASTGPAWVVLRHWRASMNLRLDKIWLGGDELGLYSSLNPIFTYQFNNGELTFSGSVTDRSYDSSGNSTREGTYVKAGASLGVYFNQRKVASQVGLNFIDFDADSDAFTHDGWEVFTGAIVKAWPNGSVYARATLRNSEYDAPQGIFTEARSETYGNASVGFKHEFSQGYLEKWALSGNYSLSDNDSNVSLYDYERQQIGLNLSKTF